MEDYPRDIMEFEARFKKINFVPKGSCVFTEHYSAVKADVKYDGDPTTDINTGLVEPLKGTNDILIAGLALSHCVGFTLRDIIAEFSEEQIKKIVLLTDATASVQGFEKQGEDFVNEFVAKGMRLSTTKNYF